MLLRSLVAATVLASASLSSAQALLEWQAFYPESGSSETCGRLVRTDANGNLYVSAVNEGDTNDTLLIAKYDANGARQWVTNYDPSGDNFFEVNDMEIDGQGDLVLVGNSYGDTTNWVALKVSPAGLMRWTKTYADQEANSVAIDFNDQIYVAGTDLAGNGHMLLRRLSRSGTVAWTRVIDSANAAGHLGKQVAIDSDNNVLIAGHTQGVDDFARIMKYAPSGSRLFSKTYKVNAKDVHAVKILPNPAGGFFYATQASGATASFGTITSYDADGGVIWRSGFNDTAGSETVLTDLAMDASGNLMAVGDTNDPFYVQKVLFRKIGPTGNRIYQKIYRSEDTSFTRTARVVIAPDTSYYIVSTILDAGAFKTLVLKYSSVGTRIWSYVYAGAGGSDEAMDAVISGNSVVSLTMSQVDENLEALHLFKVR